MSSNFLKLWWQVSVSPKSFWLVIGDLRDGPLFFSGFICGFICLVFCGVSSDLTEKNPLSEPKASLIVLSILVQKKQRLKPLWGSSSETKSIHILLYKIEATSST